MPSPLRSPKTLSQWFELDYFRRRRLFRGLWKSLTGAALLAAGLGIAWTFLPGKQTAYQAGPLSTAHALFGHDCTQCHTEAFPTWGRLWTSNDAVRSVSDAACQKCHSGPIHHTEAEPRGCATCHHEHRDRTALARVADNHCLSCHGDLTLRSSKKSEFVTPITDFARDHPEFRLWRNGAPSDPDTIRFNHEVHLQLPRQRAKPEQAGAPLIEEWAKKEHKLECSDCHQSDSSGRYMLPIRYERHCQECHPLSVQLAGDWQGTLGERAGEFRKQPAPHPRVGQTAEAVRAALRERLTRFILRPENKGFLTGAEPAEAERVLPGWGRAERVPAREFAWVNHQLAQTERLLFDGAGGCRYCHQEKAAAAKRPDGLPEYELPTMNGIEKPWYDHSVFRHDSHTMLDCTQCHDAKNSRQTSDVLLPRIDNCRQCHSTQTQAPARSDCVECHVYHDPKLRREFRGRLTIDEARGH